MSLSGMDLCVVMVLENDRRSAERIETLTKLAGELSYPDLIVASDSVAWRDKYDYTEALDYPIVRDEWLGDEICIWLGEYLRYYPPNAPQQLLWATFMSQVRWAEIGKHFLDQWREENK